jgi:integrase
VEDYLSGHIDLHRKPKGRAEVRRLLTQHTGADCGAAGGLLLRSEAYDLLQGLASTAGAAGQVRQEPGRRLGLRAGLGQAAGEHAELVAPDHAGKLPRSKGKKIEGKHVGTEAGVLSEKEIGTLINWLPNFSKTVADALTLYLWTGCRGGEIVSMEAAEISEEPTGWWWTIPRRRRRTRATTRRICACRWWAGPGDRAARASSARASCSSRRWAASPSSRR